MSKGKAILLVTLTFAPVCYSAARQAVKPASPILALQTPSTRTSHPSLSMYSMSNRPLTLKTAIS